VCAFPAAAHDDFVDSLIYGIVYLRSSGCALSEADREFWARSNAHLHAHAEAVRASLPGSTVRDQGDGLRIVNGAYDCRYRELPPSDDGDLRPVGRGPFPRRGAW
jgi:hypothetical protein